MATASAASVGGGGNSLQGATSIGKFSIVPGFSDFIKISSDNSSRRSIDDDNGSEIINIPETSYNDNKVCVRYLTYILTIVIFY